jgi:hypothetical protein
MVVMLGDAPLLIVVGHIERIRPAPPAPFAHVPSRPSLHAETGGRAARFCAGKAA